jgi:hypothetical protein
VVSTGFFQPSVGLGRFFIKISILLSQAWLALPRSVPVSVLVDAALPDSVRVTKLDVKLQPQDPLGVASHLGSAAAGHALAERGPVFYPPRVAVEKRSGTVILSR